MGVLTPPEADARCLAAVRRRRRSAAGWVAWRQLARRTADLQIGFAALGATGLATARTVLAAGEALAEGAEDRAVELVVDAMWEQA